jgi:hypothetical protein
MRRSVLRGDTAADFRDIGSLFVQLRSTSSEFALTAADFNFTVRRMTDNRMSGLALILGSAGTIITMALHPTGHNLFAPGQLEPMARMTFFVHVLALVCMPALFLGAWGLSRQLMSPRRFSIVALVMYGFGTVAAMIAAAVSAFIFPNVARQIATGTPAASDAARIMFNYTVEIVQAFARVLVLMSSAAIVLWSISVVKSKQFGTGLGIYGCILGPVTVVAVFSGHLSLDVHGFGMVMLTQAIWCVVAGVTLWRMKEQH